MHDKLSREHKICVYWKFFEWLIRLNDHPKNLCGQTEPRYRNVQPHSWIVL